jgi:hypothetical protein
MKISRKHRHKLFWPIGLLILAVIPLCFFRHAATNQDFREKYTMEINLHPFLECIGNMKKDKSDLDIPPYGNWKRYDFTEDESSNSLKFIDLRQEIKHFKARRDTVKGIQITLSRSMPYDRFVKIIDMLNLEDVTRFSISNSAVWVHKYSRQPAHPAHRIDGDRFVCGGNFGSYPLSLNWIQYTKESIRHLPLSIVIIWFIIFGVNLFQIYRFSLHQ